MQTENSSERSEPLKPWKRQHKSAFKLSIPISLQIFSWFFLNLLLVGACALTLFTTRGSAVLNIIINSQAGNRLDAIAADVAERINGLPKERWASVLESYSRRYKMGFALTRREGDVQVGKIPPVPASVVARVRELTAAGHPRPPGPPLLPPGEAGGEIPPPPEQDGSNPNGHPPESGPPVRASLRFIVHEDGLYWIGVRVPPMQEVGRFRGPTTLLLVSSSLLAGGVFLDTSGLWLIAAVLLGSALFWLPLVRRITVPLRRMRNSAERMAQGHFDTRLDLKRSDEIGSLAVSLNHLSSRLEDFVSGQKRFLGDIAHELGSPLARMRFALGIVEQNATPEMQALLEDVEEEVVQMSALLGEILQFSKAGMQSELHMEEIAVEQVILKALHQENIDRESVEWGLPSDLCVHADAHYLQRAIANILRNAIRYAGNAGPIRIEAKRTQAGTLLTLSDCGPGVPPELVHRLCDPFFRTENARTRETGGTGLGLAIVKRCVEACGGTVSIRNRAPHGLSVELTLLSAKDTRSLSSQLIRSATGLLRRP